MMTAESAAPLAAAAAAAQPQMQPQMHKSHLQLPSQPPVDRVASAPTTLRPPSYAAAMPAGAIASPSPSSWPYVAGTPTRHHAADSPVMSMSPSPHPQESVAAVPGVASSAAMSLVHAAHSYEMEFCALNETRLRDAFGAWKDGYEAEVRAFIQNERSKIESAYADLVTAQAQENAQLRARLAASVETMANFDRWIGGVLAAVPREEGEEQHARFNALRPPAALLSALPPVNSIEGVFVAQVAPARFVSRVPLPQLTLLPLSPGAALLSPNASIRTTVQDPLSLQSSVEDAPSAPWSGSSSVNYSSPARGPRSVPQTPSPGALRLPPPALDPRTLFVNRTPPRSGSSSSSLQSHHKHSSCEDLQSYRKQRQTPLATAAVDSAVPPYRASNHKTGHIRNLSATLPLSPNRPSLSRYGTTGAMQSPGSGGWKPALNSAVFLRNATLPSQPNSNFDCTPAESQANSPSCTPPPVRSLQLQTPTTSALVSPSNQRLKTLASPDKRTGVGEVGVFLKDRRSKKEQEGESANISRTLPDRLSGFQMAQNPHNYATLQAGASAQSQAPPSPRWEAARRASENRLQALLARVETSSSSESEDDEETEPSTASSETHGQESSWESDSDSDTKYTSNPLLKIVAMNLVSGTLRSQPDMRFLAARRASIARVMSLRARLELDEDSDSEEPENAPPPTSVPSPRHAAPVEQPAVTVIDLRQEHQSSSKAYTRTAQQRAWRDWSASEECKGDAVVQEPTSAPSVSSRNVAVVTSSDEDEVEDVIEVISEPVTAHHSPRGSRDLPAAIKVVLEAMEPVDAESVAFSRSITHSPRAADYHWSADPPSIAEAGYGKMVITSECRARGMPSSNRTSVDWGASQYHSSAASQAQSPLSLSQPHSPLDNPHSPMGQSIEADAIVLSRHSAEDDDVDHEEESPLSLAEHNPVKALPSTVGDLSREDSTSELWQQRLAHSPLPPVCNASTCTTATSEEEVKHREDDAVTDPSATESVKEPAEELPSARAWHNDDLHVMDILEGASSASHDDEKDSSSTLHQTLSYKYTSGPTYSYAPMQSSFALAPASLAPGPTGPVDAPAREVTKSPDQGKGFEPPTVSSLSPPLRKRTLQIHPVPSRSAGYSTLPSSLSSAVPALPSASAPLSAAKPPSAAAATAHLSLNRTAQPMFLGSGLSGAPHAPVRHAACTSGARRALVFS